MPEEKICDVQCVGRVPQQTCARVKYAAAESRMEGQLCLRKNLGPGLSLNTDFVWILSWSLDSIYTILRLFVLSPNIGVSCLPKLVTRCRLVLQNQFLLWFFCLMPASCLWYEA